MVILAGLSLAVATERPVRPAISDAERAQVMDDLRDFSAVANVARSSRDWGSVYTSLLAEHQERCTRSEFVALADAENVARERGIEGLLLDQRPGYMHFVEPPSVAWAFAGAERVGEGFLITQVGRVHPQGGVVARIEEHWAEGDGGWWLDATLLVAQCTGAELPAVDANAALAFDDNSYRRPAPVGATLDVGDTRLTLTAAVRGDDAPIAVGVAPAGFVQVYVELRIETTDGSQLRLATNFVAASMDGVYYAGSDRRGLHTCARTEHLGITCQVYLGVVTVAEDDVAPRLAWVESSLAARGQGERWWTLPGAAEVQQRSAEAASVALDSFVDVAQWDTDFTRSTVPLGEVVATGQRRDNIPAIRSPRVTTVEEADDWLADREAVQVVEFNGEVRAYPIRIVISHEIVNDVLGGEPVLVTYCPLCNTALAFERRVGVRVPVFETTGLLRFSNLVMFDERTESWWQQAMGEAIVGEMAGAVLTAIPSRLTSWENFKRGNPQGSVLSSATGFDRDYGVNFYLNYDSGITDPDFFNGTLDRRLPTFERVLGLMADDDEVAIPFGELALRRVVHAQVGNARVVAFYQTGTNSPLDKFQVAAGRDVGSAAAYLAEIDGQALTFGPDRGEFRDDETGSRWNLLGTAVRGPLEGRSLPAVFQDSGFWFSWVSFHPGTRIYAAPIL